MIGEKLKKIREQKKYSITELAELANVSKSYLSNIERDINTNPSIDFLKKIAKPLEISLESLIAETDNEDILFDNNEKEILDKEWKMIIEKVVEDGINKDDFREYISYIKFKIWEKNKIKP